VTEASLEKGIPSELSASIRASEQQRQNRAIFKFMCNKKNLCNKSMKTQQVFRIDGIFQQGWLPLNSIKRSNRRICAALFPRADCDCSPLTLSTTCRSSLFVLRGEYCRLTDRRKRNSRVWQEGYEHLLGFSRHGGRCLDGFDAQKASTYFFKFFRAAEMQDCAARVKV